MSVSGMLNMTPLPHAWMTSSSSGPPTPASSMRERYLMDTPKRRSSASRIGFGGGGGDGGGGRQGLMLWERSGSATHDNDGLHLTRGGEEEEEEEREEREEREEERERRSWGDAATGKNSTKEEKEKEKKKKRERRVERERKNVILAESPLSPLGQERRTFTQIVENAEKETLVLQVEEKQMLVERMESKLVSLVEKLSLAKRDCDERKVIKIRTEKMIQKISDVITEQAKETSRILKSTSDLEQQGGGGSGGGGSSVRNNIVRTNTTRGRNSYYKRLGF